MPELTEIDIYNKILEEWEALDQNVKKGLQAQKNSAHLGSKSKSKSKDKSSTKAISISDFRDKNFALKGFEIS